MTKKEKARLRSFLRSYMKWVNAGAPDGQPYSTCFGLCSAACRYDDDKDNRFPNQVYYGLGAMLERDFEENSNYPFGGCEVYLKSSGRHHENPARLAWIAKTIEELS